MLPRPNSAKCTCDGCKAAVRQISSKQHAAEVSVAVMKNMARPVVKTKDEARAICDDFVSSLPPPPKCLPDRAAETPSVVNYYQPMLDAGFDATGLRNFDDRVGLKHSQPLMDYLSERDTSLDHIAVFVDGLTWANTVAFPTRWRITGDGHPSMPVTTASLGNLAYTALHNPLEAQREDAAHLLRITQSRVRLGGATYLPF